MTTTAQVLQLINQIPLAPVNNSTGYASSVAGVLRQIVGLLGAEQSANVFVFRPGEPSPAGNVYDSFSELMQAAGQANGPVTVQFDNSLQAVNVPAGVWDFSDMMWLGDPAAPSPVPLTVDDGATFVALPASIVSLAVSYAGAAPVIQPTASPELTLVRSTLAGGAPSPMVVVAAGSFRLILRDSMLLAGAGPVLDAGDRPVTIDLLEGSSVADQAVAGLPAGSLTARLFDGTVSAAAGLPAFQGTLTVTRLDLAAGHSYDDSTSPQVAGTPATVQSALDGLKARGLAGGPLQGTVTTTDATTTTVLALPVIPDGVLLVQANVVGRDPGGADRAGFVIRARVDLDASVASVNDVAAEYTSRDNVAWAATIAIVGGVAAVRVTGTAGQTVNWRANATVQQLP